MCLKSKFPADFADLRRNILIISVYLRDLREILFIEVTIRIIIYFILCAKRFKRFDNPLQCSLYFL